MSLFRISPTWLSALFWPRPFYQTNYWKVLFSMKCFGSTGTQGVSISVCLLVFYLEHSTFIFLSRSINDKIYFVLFVLGLRIKDERNFCVHDLSPIFSEDCKADKYVILASDWSTWPEYWPLIGADCSRDVLGCQPPCLRFFQTSDKLQRKNEGMWLKDQNFEWEMKSNNKEMFF